jgi:hypothetical protein
MTTRTPRRVPRAVLLLLAAACAGCASHAVPARPAHVRPHPRPALTSPPAAAPPPAAALPFTRSRLDKAARLAAWFTAAWDSWSWQQPPADWLARLRPATATELAGALARAAGIPSVLAQRDRTRQTAAATATALRIRDLTPGSVTIIVTIRQAVTSRAGTTRATARYAVTLIPRRAGWAVWDIEPAAAGNR